MLKDELAELLEESFEHLRSGRFRMALTSAEKLFEGQQNNAKVAACYAWALLENGKPAHALEIANIAVQLAPEDADVRLYRGFLLMRMSIFEGAITDIDWAIYHKAGQLAWAHINKARALAGLSRHFEALEEVERAIEIDKGANNKLFSLRDWFKKATGYTEDFFRGILKEEKSLLDEAQEALKQKEYWFSLWASRKLLNTPARSHEHNQAHLIELESLLGQFQIKAASQKAHQLTNLLSDDQRFQNILNKIQSFGQQNEYEEEISVSDHALFERTDFVVNKNSNVKAISAKTYDLIEEMRSGKRTYLLAFNESILRYIGLEVTVTNPYFNKSQMTIEGTAVWHLNGVEVGIHNFELNLEKSWQTVVFIQSWGTDYPGFWRSGQGRVDVFLSGEKVCERWFLIGDTEVVNFEEEEFPPIMKQTKIENISDQPFSVQESALRTKDDIPLELLLEELNSFVGLKNLKQSMRDFIDYLKFIKERKRLGLKAQDIFSIHCVFLGNPGTGKTTIARLLGKIFKAMGLLKNGHLIEVDRSGLVGQFIGETAQKTDKVINEALGGLLFIDEAYSLAKKSSSAQDFGQEAIDILLKRMEDKPGEFVVIAAGYPEEMKSFINSNPGLKSRFTHYFEFSDYSPDELVEIFKLISENEDYKIQSEAERELKKHLINLYRNRDSSFGNARLVRNLFNEAKMQLGKRYLRMPEKERTREAMATISVEDLRASFIKSVSESVKIGIDEENLTRTLSKLNKLVGLDSVKKEVEDLVKLARFYYEQGESLQEKFFSHFLFAGNPGTGKTSVARIFSELYSALGILPKGHLIETDRQGLVAGYVGQTAEKTKELIDRAMGGTLFIDEIPSLSKKDKQGESDFGKEALNTLLKRMEDERGKFLVIGAGYNDEVENFISSNPGIHSRFARKIVFDDYTPDHLVQITKQLLESKGYLLADEAIDPMRKYFMELYRNRDRSFGNARLARALVEGSLKNQLLRVADIPVKERNKSNVKEILLEDVKEIISLKKEKKIVKIEGNPELLDEYVKELHELTGLQSVKKSVDKLISSLKVGRLREERGLKVIQKNLHSVFTGNPGTGKTTVARLLSKIYKELGMLEKGHLVEIDRSSLVAGYQGQTALKTEKVIEQALGGTLFIDEAYSLTRSAGDFGQEAVDTLIKRMEDYQGKFVVIAAGYPVEMREFLEANPGLQSRFSNYFSFEDYTPRQLLEITAVISDKNGYKLDEGAWQLLLELYTRLYNQRDKNFGNARMVKNILYKAISSQEERILTLYNLSDEDLSTISMEDVFSINEEEFLSSK